ncbi:uncharacterized protein LOC114520918 isoform X2 [Dendronephthya gigantea]|nr:uncharacterized protein LOC114520918 isoform X2 [Dendronephthya gigantea]
MKEQLKHLKDDQSSDRKKIEMLEEKLENLETGYMINNAGTSTQCQLKSCIPDKPETFIGRDDEVKQIISYLVENRSGIVSIVGGPGFGKSTVAIEVCHDLSNNNDTVVFFSYLQNISTVAEVILRLCQDVGVYPGENPESSLLLGLKSIERKVVLVMDNIEQLLESNEKPHFVELVLTLRKNVGQHLQILTTSRTEFTIHEQQFIVNHPINHPIQKMDERFSVELLKRCCPNVEISDAYLNELADLCGGVPLALCIAGTIIPDLDDPSELIQWLKVRPMEALKRVEQAFEFSLQKLSDEDKKSLICLSVFDGNFQRNSAKEVIGRDGLKTLDFLKNLVSRSLIQRTGDKRFVIHSLIRRFLADHVQFKEERAIAQELMVTHFLKMCHTLTLECYSKNGFTSARESLKKDVHNVEEMLRICTQVSNLNSKPNISELLASSDIYKSSCRFFHSFTWDLIPEPILRNFFESCIQLAESRNERTIKMLFQCLVATQEGRRSFWNSTEYANRIGDIQEAFYKNKTILKEDRYIFMFCHHLLARHYFKKLQNSLPSELLEVDLPCFPEKEQLSPMKKVAEVYILKKRGNLSKMMANKESRRDKQKKEEFMRCSESFYIQALSLARKILGDHELTCALHKLLGDLYFNWHKNDEALMHYEDAVNLHKKLKLDSNEQFVMLLKNFGGCLSFLRRFNESVERLKEARDIADKITEKNTDFKAQVYCELAISCCSTKLYREEAAEYVKDAMNMQELLDTRKVKKLAVENFIMSLPKIANVQGNDGMFQLKSCIPDKPQTFIGRDAVVKQIITSLVANDCRIVSIVGGPGFGKTTVAVEVSHHLNNDHDIVVIFSSLSNASTVDEVRRRLCRDVGVSAGKDSKLSLMFWSKNINRKVVLVLDSIEQLLQSNVISEFTKLMLSLCNHPHQLLQILTTTQTKFVLTSITLKTSVNHEIKELDETSSIELLRKCCCLEETEIKPAYLSELAGLCAFVPLALCITGTLIRDLKDPSQLIQWLSEKPMENLSYANQCMEQALTVSFQNLSDEEKKALICLSVFVGNFQMSSAKEVINKSRSQAEILLQSLLRRCLVQQTSDGRFVIHSLIREFLDGHDQFKEEKAMAQGLMVSHFLKMCHSLTMKGYSKNGFTSARESLKKDVHNVEKTFEVCSQDKKKNLNPNIPELLASSDIYKSSSRFFNEFSWDLFPLIVLRKFFESCAKLAKNRNQPAIEIAFLCLVADQIGHECEWKSKYSDRVNAINEALKDNDALRKKDRSLFIFCHYIFSRSDSDKPTYEAPPDLEDDGTPLDEDKCASPIVNAAEVYFLLQRGDLNRRHAIKLYKGGKEGYYEYFKNAESFYNQALTLSKELFGDHGFTCHVHDLLGDLYLERRDNTKALMCYTECIILCKELELYSYEHFAYLLKNCATCLSYLGYFDESVTTLKKACTIADHQMRCRAVFYLALAGTYRRWKPDCQDAAIYAKEAMKMRHLLNSRDKDSLQEIIKTAEGH